MKRIYVLLLVIALVLGATSCGKISEAIGNKVGEKIIEDTSGGSVDINGDSVSIKGDNGETVVLGGTEWPKDNEVSKQIPEFTKGKIDGVYSADGESAGITVVISEVEEKDFKAYLEQVKSAGYKEESSTLESEGSTVYTASNGKGYTVVLSYGNDKTMMITATKTE